MKIDSLESVIEDVKLGKPVVLIDDVDRENEGDLMVAAEKITPEIINFMVSHGKGLICVSLTEERLRELQIPMQVTENSSVFGTNFAVSIDHSSVIDSPVSSHGRGTTIKATVSDDARPEDFVMPGFVFPVCAVPGGVLKRRGQTEGSVDLSLLSGLKPAGVICEIMGEQGEMLRGSELHAFCKQHALKISSVEEIVQYRLRNEVSIRRVAEFPFTKEIGFDRGPELNTLFAAHPEANLNVVVYVDDVDDKEHIAIVKGSPSESALVRIHSECLTGDVFDSVRCDCGNQFDQALGAILSEGEGVLVYLQQEGRGIGLGNKLRAYELQDQGRDTVDANLELGFAPDERDYRVGAQILCDLGISQIRLMTNNPDKLESLEAFGIKVVERRPISGVIHEHNREYLDTKRTRMGHLISDENS